MKKLLVTFVLLMSLAGAFVIEASETQTKGEASFAALNHSPGSATLQRHRRRRLRRLRRRHRRARRHMRRARRRHMRRVARRHMRRARRRHRRM